MAKARKLKKRKLPESKPFDRNTNKRKTKNKKTIIDNNTNIKSIQQPVYKNLLSVSYTIDKDNPNKSKIALWYLYKWALEKEQVSINSRKPNSSWEDFNSVKDNDWFVIQFSDFDLFLQATDSFNLDIPPYNKRGLFVQLKHRLSSIPQNQLALVSPMVNKENIAICITGDDRRLVFCSNTGQECDGGFLAGCYDAPDDPKVPPLVLLTGVFNRSEQGNVIDQDSRLVCKNEKESISVFPPSLDWQLKGELGFTHAFWIKLNKKAKPGTLLGCSGISGTSNGPIWVWFDGTYLNWFFVGNERVLRAVPPFEEKFHAVFSVGDFSSVFYNGVEVDRCHRTSFSFSYCPDRNLTLGGIARNADPLIVSSYWDGVIFDYVVYSRAKDENWVERQVSRFVPFLDGEAIPQERGGILTEDGIGSFTIFSKGDILLTDSWQPNLVYSYPEYDELSIWIKVKSRVMGSLPLVKATYGEHWKFRKGSLVLGEVSFKDRSLSLNFS